MSEVETQSSVNKMEQESGNSTGVDGQESIRSRKGILIAGIVALALVLLIGFSQNWFGGGGSSSEPVGGVDEAVSLINSGDADAARVILQEVVADDPLNVLANYNLGVIAQFSGDAGAAVGYYTIALQGEPLFSNALYNIGLAYRDIGQVDLAITSLKTLVANFPDYAPGLYNLGTLLVDQGDTASGEAYIARAKKIDPSLGS